MLKHFEYTIISSLVLIVVYKTECFRCSIHFRCGVMQGESLSPILYILFVNNIQCLVYILVTYVHIRKCIVDN